MSQVKLRKSQREAGKKPRRSWRGAKGGLVRSALERSRRGTEENLRRSQRGTGEKLRRGRRGAKRRRQKGATKGNIRPWRHNNMVTIVTALATPK